MGRKDAKQKVIGILIESVDSGSITYNKEGKIIAAIVGKTLSYPNDYLPRILDGVGAEGFDGMPGSDLDEIETYFVKEGAKDPGLPKMALMMLTADGMCGNGFGVDVDDNVQHESGLRDFINDYKSNARDRLDDRIRSFFKPIDKDTTFEILTAFNVQAVFLIVTFTTRV
jgi:hypothetical protein